VREIVPQGRRVSWIVIAKLGAGIAGSHYLIRMRG